MANETHGFIRVPPDGGGKRLTHSVMVECRIGTVTGTPMVGERCAFGTSGLVGTISEVTLILPNDYDLHVSLTDPIPDNVKPILTESFTQNGVQIGQVNSVGELFYSPQTVLVGGTNNINQLEVDEAGAAWVAFPNGSPNFDAYGKLQTSTQRTLASYVHRYNTLDDLFTTDIIGSGSYSHEPDTSGCVVSCGTESGASVTRTTDLYHIYQPGISQLLMFTGALGDSGKAGVVRRAGLYDDDNGLFFEMFENTFNVVIRSKSTGVVIEHKVPSSNWNIDRMDGQGGVFNPSGVALDPTKDNVYWLDYQWLGAGAVRFGTFIDGKRVAVHMFNRTNELAYSYMSYASLPFRYEQRNISATGSSSEFRIFGATVKSEGQCESPRVLVSTTVTTNITSQTAIPILSVRPVATINTLPNRGTVYMYGAQVYNHGTDPVMVELQRAAVTTNGAWTAAAAGSIAEVNTTATSYTGGTPNWFIIVPPGSVVKIDIDAYDENRQGFRRKANINLAVEQLMTARLLSGSTGGNVTVVVSWDEVRT